MADRVETYDVTVPAGTAKAAPAVAGLHFAQGYLRRWSVVIPLGVSALAGFAFAYGGQQLIPNEAGTWITGNGEVIADDAGFHFVGDQWTLIGYNLDIYDHTFHVRLFIDELSTGADAQAPGTPTYPLTIVPDTVDLGGPANLDVIGTLAAADTVTPPELPALDTAPDGTDTAGADTLDTAPADTAATLDTEPTVTDVTEASA